MKKQIKTTHSIAAPASAIWNQLRTGENVDKWFPPITACRVEGNRRYCEAGEASLKETIESSDDETMTFVYSIQEQNLMPVSNIKGSMQVEPVDDGNCLRHWNVEFDVADEPTFAMVKQGTEEMYVAGATGLEEMALAA